MYYNVWTEKQPIIPRILIDLVLFQAYNEHIPKLLQH